MSQQTFCSVTAWIIAVRYFNIVKFLDSEFETLYGLDVWTSLRAFDVPVSLAPSPQFTVYLEGRGMDQVTNIRILYSLSTKTSNVSVRAIKLNFEKYHL